MNKSKLSALIQSKLSALRTLLQEAQAGCETVTLDQTRVGRLSRMDAMQSQAMNQAAQQRRKDEIDRLQNALQRFDSGDYGYCEDCGEEIAEGRLMLDPAAGCCVLCASRHEQG